MSISINSQVHRLCVCASGSLTTDIFICWTLVSVSCLHFGQNKGKFSSTVSSRNLNLVLFPHTGHNNHFSCFMLIPPVVLFLTALFECFIKLSYQRPQSKGGVLSVVKQDFLSSMQYISKEQVSISKMLLLTAFSRFFVMGITIVGMPYIVRTVLGFNAQYYGAAESALAVATILGSVAAGLLATKMKIQRLSILLASMGVFMIPAGIIFLCPVNPIIKYVITVVSLCGMQAAISIFFFLRFHLYSKEHQII